MPTNRDKGTTEKDGGKPSQQKAPGGPSSTAGVDDPALAMEARGGNADDEIDADS